MYHSTREFLSLEFCLAYGECNERCQCQIRNRKYSAKTAQSSTLMRTTHNHQVECCEEPTIIKCCEEPTITQSSKSIITMNTPHPLSATPSLENQLMPFIDNKVDHSADTKHGKANGSAREFPLKLYRLLEEADEKEYSDIVSWQGLSSFRVHQPKRFEAEILATVFRQSKYKSFLRQLNIYEFQRIQYGPNKGGYAHPQLVRGRPELLSKMQRIFVPRKRPVDINKQTIPKAVQSCASTSVYSSDTPLENVDLNNIIPSRSTSKNPIEEAHGRLEPLPELLIPELPLICNDNTSLGPSGFLENKDLSLFEVRDLFQESPVGELPGEDWLFNLVDSEVSSSDNTCSASQPQCDGWYESLWIPTAEEYARSCQETLSLSTDQVSEDGSQCSINEDLSRSEAVFPQKLHKLLQDADSKGFHTVVSWINDGSAFRVHDVSAFVESVMPLYFNQSKYPSFRRQLNLYGFTRVPSAIHGSYFVHRCFLQDNPELCNQIVRMSSKSPSSSSPKH